MIDELVFFDTNVLVELIGDLNPGRKELVQNLFLGLQRERLWISNQVLVEAFNVLTRKVSNPLTKAEARTELSLFLSHSSLISLNGAQVLDAFQRSIDLHLSHWDALIVTAAIEAGCSVLYTEDLSHGQTIEGLWVVNPFLNAG